MSLPEQVRLQAQRADELMAQANAAPGEPTLAPEADATPAPQAVVEPATATAPAPAPVPAPAPAPEDFEHKYRTLQGVFAAHKREADSRIASLEQKIASAPVAPTPAPAPAAPLVTDRDRETYGDDMIDLIGRKAQEMAETIVTQRMAELQPMLDQTRDQVTNVSTQVYQSTQEKFYGELAKAVPDYQQIDLDPRWLNWLGENDPLSGVARQVYLDNAGQALDHVRVANLFNAFKDAAGLNKPAPAPAPAPRVLSPTPQTVGTASAPTHTPAVVRVSRSEIQAHYSRSARDAAYRDGEGKAFEARMQQALLTNTVEG